MTASVVIAIIALIVAICAMVMVSSADTNTDSANSDNPSTEEGRKVCVVRGTAWVKSTQITVFTDDYTAS